MSDKFSSQQTTEHAIMDSYANERDVFKKLLAEAGDAGVAAKVYSDNFYPLNRSATSRMENSIASVAFQAGVAWQSEKELIPSNAHSLEVFDIKRNGDGVMEAFIGFKLPTGCFHFIQVPYKGRE